MTLSIKTGIACEEAISRAVRLAELRNSAGFRGELRLPSVGLAPTQQWLVFADEKSIFSFYGLIFGIVVFEAVKDVCNDFARIFALQFAAKSWLKCQLLP